MAQTPAEPQPGARCEFAVIGGGATGYAAAIGLSAAGRPVTLFAPPVRDHPARTAALLHSSVEILDDLGIWPAARAEAEPLVRMRIIDGTRRLMRGPELTFDAREIGLSAFGYNIANGVLVDMMAELANARDNLDVVEQPAEALTRSGNGWRVSWQDKAIEADFLVGADGRNSLVADVLQVGKKSWSYPQSALVGIVRCSEPHRNTSTEFHYANGPVTLVPMSGNRVSVVWVDQQARIDDLLDRDDGDFAGLLEERVRSVLGKLETVGPRAAFPLSGMRAQDLGGHAAVLVGEAAHVLPPIGAQGLNLGMRDVACLCRLVTQFGSDLSTGALVSGYQRERQGDIRSRSLAVDMLNRSLMTDFLPIQAARSIGLNLAGRMPVFRKFLMKQGIASYSAQT